MTTQYRGQKLILPEPTLIIGSGIGGTGKTTYLSHIAHRVHDAFHIDKDDINNALLATHTDADNGVFQYRFSGPKKETDYEYFGKHVKFQSYHAMLLLAAHVLQNGQHPMLDAPYAKEIPMGYFDHVVFPLFQNFPHKTKWLHFWADEETIKARRRARNARQDNVPELKCDQEWAKYLAAQPILPSALERYNHLKVDTRVPLEENLDRIVAYLCA